jgi:hypothetical protein
LIDPCDEVAHCVLASLFGLPEHPDHAGLVVVVALRRGACVRACQLGCELRSIDRLAYVDLPAEVQLVWSKRLAG